MLQRRHAVDEHLDSGASDVGCGEVDVFEAQVVGDEMLDFVVVAGEAWGSEMFERVGEDAGGAGEEAWSFVCGWAWFGEEAGCAGGEGAFERDVFQGCAVFRWGVLLAAFYVVV